MSAAIPLYPQAARPPPDGLVVVSLPLQFQKTNFHVTWNLLLDLGFQKRSASALTAEALLEPIKEKNNKGDR